MTSEINKLITFESAIYNSFYLVIAFRVARVFYKILFEGAPIYSKDSVLNIFLCIRSVIKFISDVLYGAIILMGLYYCNEFFGVNIFNLCLLILFLFISKILINKFINKRVQ